MAAKKVILGADHAGFALKEKLKQVLKDNEIAFDDLSPALDEADDYPDIAFKAAKKVAREKNLGILICGTGIGMCITANKVKGIRAALAYDENTARLSRQHNDANILCLGGRTIDEKLAKRILKVWLNTRFLEGRHARRVEKISKYE
ncbi:ribose 5-phosphate isomerase B [Candidatus Woesearchaeota archaeon]|nr:ribose 5-phosphate isomerase B [Candidatus Woesearchaeota archaeon]